MIAPTRTRIHTKPGPALEPDVTAERIACSGLSDCAAGALDWLPWEPLAAPCPLLAPVRPLAPAEFDPLVELDPVDRPRTAWPTVPEYRSAAAVCRDTLPPTRPL